MVDFPNPFVKLTSFQWNEGNSEKNWHTHAVTRAEAEQAFLNRPVVVAEDVKHAQNEPRLVLLGRTDADRQLFVAFTIPGSEVQVISARPMSRSERRRYAKAIEEEAEADA